MDSVLSEKNNINKIDFLIVIHNINLRGGTEIMALNLMNALNNSGSECYILSLIPYNGNDNHIISLQPQIVKRVLAVYNNYFFKLFYSNKQWHLLKKYLTYALIELSPRICINFTYDLLPAIPTHLKGICICGIFHWSIQGYEQSLLKQTQEKGLIHRVISRKLLNRKFKTVRKCLPQLDKLITLTDEGKREVLRLKSDININKICIIPNFIPFDFDCSNISTLKNKTVIFVGRLSREKGCYRLINIWDIFSQALPDWQIKIYGEGEEKIGMENEIRNRGLQNICFCGYESKLEKIYSQADMLFCTSDSEGFGLVIVEAMYYGVIPVSFDCPVSPRELIGDAGELVRCYDCQSFAKTAILLASSYDRMRALQINALKKATLFYKSQILNLWKRLMP